MPSYNVVPINSQHPSVLLHKDYTKGSHLHRRSDVDVRSRLAVLDELLRPGRGLVVVDEVGVGRCGGALALELGHDLLVGVPGAHSGSEEAIHLLETVRRRGRLV